MSSVINGPAVRALPMPRLSFAPPHSHLHHPLTITIHRIRIRTTKYTPLIRTRHIRVNTCTITHVRTYNIHHPLFPSRHTVYSLHMPPPTSFGFGSRRTGAATCSLAHLVAGLVHAPIVQLLQVSLNSQKANSRNQTPYRLVSLHILTTACSQPMGALSKTRA